MSLNKNVHNNVLLSATTTVIIKHHKKEICVKVKSGTGKGKRGFFVLKIVFYVIFYFVQNSTCKLCSCLQLPFNKNKK